MVSNIGIEGILKNVLYSPEIPNNLLSVARMQQAGYTVIIDAKGVKINKGEMTVIRGKSLGNLFNVDCTIVKNMINSVKSECNYDLWHQRLGHIGKSKF